MEYWKIRSRHADAQVACLPCTMLGSGPAGRQGPGHDMAESGEVKDEDCVF